MTQSWHLKLAANAKKHENFWQNFFKIWQKKTFNVRFAVLSLLKVNCMNSFSWKNQPKALRIDDSRGKSVLGLWAYLWPTWPVFWSIGCYIRKIQIKIIGFKKKMTSKAQILADLRPVQNSNSNLSFSIILLFWPLFQKWNSRPHNHSAYEFVEQSRLVPGLGATVGTLINVSGNDFKRRFNPYKSPKGTPFREKPAVLI